MTTKAAFTPEEWTVVLEGPPTAGMIVITAAHGGMVRETIAMSKAYAEARAEHGESELLDEIVAAKPHVDHTRYHSAEELKEHGLGHLRDAVALLESKATPEERDDYRRFVAGPRRPGRGRPQGTRSGREPGRGSGDPGDHGGARRGRFLTKTETARQLARCWRGLVIGRCRIPANVAGAAALVPAYPCSLR